MILFLFLQGFFIILMAPLITGFIKQMKSWMQQKKAPPLFQPYFVLSKLLIKQPVMAHNASWIFRLAPYAFFTIVCVLCFSLPFFTTHTFASTSMDMIVFVGLLALARIIITLAAMDIGTAFGNLGARRELFIACLAEPVLLIILLNVALLTHHVYFSSSSAYFLNHLQLFPSLMFSFLSLIFIAMAETGRVPIDNAATHLELTMVHEAMILEYSGRDLMLIEWGNSIKLTIYIILLSIVFIPWGLHTDITFYNMVCTFLITIFKLALFTAFIGFIESINCKLRFFKIPDYISVAFMLATLGVLITQLIGAA